MFAKYIILLIVLLKVSTDARAMESFVENVDKGVNFDECQSLSFNPPLTMEIQNRANPIVIRFAKIFCAHKDENIFMIANIRENASRENAHTHSREDYFKIQSLIQKRQSFTHSKLQFEQGTAYFDNDTLFFLGHYDVFLTEDPFTRGGGLSPEVVARLLMDPFKNKHFY